MIDENFLSEVFKEYSPRFDLDNFCFDKQLKFIKDTAPFKIAVCSRRSGKTIACAADLVHTALNKDKIVCLYITLSRNNAKKIIWEELLDINRKFNLNAQSNETELSLKFPNGSVVYLSGAKDKSEIEKFRGLAIALCYIDECGSFREYIQNLVDEVISKALFDHNGTLCLIGTPSPVPSGYFHDCWVSPQWSKHEWTMFDNPWLQIKSGKTPQELLDRELTRKGITVDDPTIQRECFGRWTIDSDALVFRYNSSINDFVDLPPLNNWKYILGIDIGFDDSDAIAVIGWNDKCKSSYLCHEIVTPKQGITDLANQIQRLIGIYDPESIVMDTGGLGKKIAEEMNKRFGLPIRPAEKTRKFEYIELLNDALRTKRFFAKKSGRFAQDAMLVEWDKDSAQLKISDRFHSDICDAVLYAFRESLHWLTEDPKPTIEVNSPEWYDKQEKDMEAFAEINQKRKESNNRELLEDSGLSYDEGWY